MTPVTASQSLVRPVRGPAGENRVLLAAFLVSLVLHVVGMFVMQRVPVDVASRTVAPREQTVEIAMADDDPAAARAVAEAERQEKLQEDQRERIFTSIPERLASDTPPPDDPTQPQYLAMYHSLAANPVMGGDAVQPSAPNAGEFASVEVRREQLEGAPGVSVQARPAVTAPAEASQATPEAQAAAQEQAAAKERAQIEQERKRLSQFDGGALGTDPVPRAAEQVTPENEAERPATRPAALAQWWSGEAPSIYKSGGGQGSGDRGFDFDRDAQGMETSGVARVGAYSLNTWEWNYAPWMQSFENRLMANWMPPEARRLGLIWGKTVLKVVIEKDGTISAAEILETEGHESLHAASRAALVSSSPLIPLPSHFPLAQLEIHLTMVYPKPPR